MTVVRIANRHVDREMYEALVAESDLDHQHPLGLIVHGASEIDGMMHVAQIWDSEDYARRYDRLVLHRVNRIGTHRGLGRRRKAMRGRAHLTPHVTPRPQ